MAAVLSALIASGCSVYQRYEASKPDAVKKTEAMLSDAGFTTIKLDSSDKVGLVEDLPPYELRSYPVQSGKVYWYYDPDVCECVYEGHQGEYDRYQTALAHENDVAKYAAESSDEQVASLNALNGGFFPPPVFWIGGYAPVPRYYYGGYRGGHLGFGGRGRFGGPGGFGSHGGLGGGHH